MLHLIKVCWALKLKLMQALARFLYKYFAKQQYDPAIFSTMQR